MAITVEQIDRWRASASETQVLEFKEAKTQYDNEKLFSYCVAIANEGGGHILLGIKNKPPREVVGTGAINDPIGMTDKILQKLNFRVEIDVIPHPNGRVVALTIPSRPRGTPLHLEGRYLMRSGESLTSMTPDQIRKIIEEGKPDWLEEFSDIEVTEAERVISLLDTQIYFERIGLPYPSTRGAVLSRFCSERLIEESNGGRYRIKRLAAILFAKRWMNSPMSSARPRGLSCSVALTDSQLSWTRLEREDMRPDIADLSITSCRSYRKMRWLKTPFAKT